MTWYDIVFAFWCKGFHIMGKWSSFRTIKVNTGKVLKVLVVYYYLPLAGDPCSIGELTRDVY